EPVVRAGVERGGWQGHQRRLVRSPQPYERARPVGCRRSRQRLLYRLWTPQRADRFGWRAGRRAMATRHQWHQWFLDRPAPAYGYLLRPELAGYRSFRLDG